MERVQVAATKSMSYRAIAFDLGGVLLDSEEAHENAARRVAAQFGLFVPDQKWPHIRGGAYEGFFDQVLALPENVRHGVRPMDVVLRAYDFYHEEVQGSACLFPNTVDVLELSRTTFDYVAIATSSEWRLVEATLEHFRLADYFDGIVSGDHITQKKPAAEVFLVAAWLLGVRPSSMIVVEDSMHGIRAARLARAHVIGIATSKDPEALLAAKAHHVVRDHGELVAYIRRLTQEGQIAQRPR
jgi:beta-phosphoglucomutase-like phosphatase (HAD superfamily)